MESLWKLWVRLGKLKKSVKILSKVLKKLEKIRRNTNFKIIIVNNMKQFMNTRKEFIILSKVEKFVQILCKIYQNFM